MARQVAAASAGLVSVLCATLSAAGAYAAGPAAMRVTSPAFVAGGEIPMVHTCGGADTPPPLHWSNVPTGTRSLLLIR